MIGFPLISGCETIQAMTGNEVTEENNNAISVFETQPECTKLPLMADLTRSYTNRIYIEDGKPCTKLQSTNLQKTKIQSTQ